MPSINKALIRRFKRRDSIARWMITLGGVAVIASVAAILLLIVSITFPLFRPPYAERRGTVNLPDKSRGNGRSCAGHRSGRIGRKRRGGFPHRIPARPRRRYHVSGLCGQRSVAFAERRSAGREIGCADFGPRRSLFRLGAKDRILRSVERHAGSEFTLLWSDGSVSLVAAELKPEFDELGRRSVKHSLKIHASLPPDGKEIPLQALLRKGENDDLTCVKLLSNSRLSVLRRYRHKSPDAGLLDEPETVTKRSTIEEGIPGPITALTMDKSGRNLFAGTANGCLAQWEFGDEGQILRHDVVPAFRDQRAITALAMMLGDISLAVGDERGELTIWTEIREDSSDDGQAAKSCGKSIDFRGTTGRYATSFLRAATNRSSV